MKNEGIWKMKAYENEGVLWKMKMYEKWICMKNESVCKWRCMKNEGIWCMETGFLEFAQ